MGDLLLVCPVAMLKRKMIIKLPKRFLERGQSKTNAQCELQPMFAGPGPHFANVLLAFFFVGHAA